MCDKSHHFHLLLLTTVGRKRADTIPRNRRALRFLEEPEPCVPLNLTRVCARAGDRKAQRQGEAKDFISACRVDSTMSDLSE